MPDSQQCQEAKAAKNYKWLAALVGSLGVGGAVLLIIVITLFGLCCLMSVCTVIPVGAYLHEKKKHKDLEQIQDYDKLLDIESSRSQLDESHKVASCILAEITGKLYDEMTCYEVADRDLIVSVEI